jgi:hypothetical protein
MTRKIKEEMAFNDIHAFPTLSMDDPADADEQAVNDSIRVR